MKSKDNNTDKRSKKILCIDNLHSKRFISLDPSGYFLIKLKRDNQEIIVEHYDNEIDKSGIAIDPETGEPIDCNNGKARLPIKIYKGRSAKEVGIQLTEGKEPYPISRLDHALYIGRELQKAEFSLVQDLPYLQD